MVKKLFNFVEEGLSLHETKTSLIMITFFISSMYSLVYTWVFGDIPSNLFFFIMGMMTAITGMNVSENYKEVKIKESHDKAKG